jgi:hypothetical protein
LFLIERIALQSRVYSEEGQCLCIHSLRISKLALSRPLFCFHFVARIKGEFTWFTSIGTLESGREENMFGMIGSPMLKILYSQENDSTLLHISRFSLLHEVCPGCQQLESTDFINRCLPCTVHVLKIARYLTCVTVLGYKG